MRRDELASKARFGRAAPATTTTVTPFIAIEPGPTLIALVALAERISPAHPSEAFDSLWLGMSWLAQGQGGGH